MGSPLGRRKMDEDNVLIIFFSVRPEVESRAWMTFPEIPGSRNQRRPSGNLRGSTNGNGTTLHLNGDWRRGEHPDGGIYPAPRTEKPQSIDSD